MRIIGEDILAVDGKGELISRVGTLFLKTPGIVTVKGVHAMQRMVWINALNEDRAKAGLPELTDEEIDEEISESVDLLFQPGLVLIRPQPDAIETALRGDEVLQTLVSKRRIRFLNTHSVKILDALKARGENWRVARMPQTREELESQIASAKVSILNETIYYYNESTGTRLLTAAGWTAVTELPPERMRPQVEEIVHGLGARNRLGQPEVALFPRSLDPSVTAAVRSLRPLPSDDAALRNAVIRTGALFRAAVPENLRLESVKNLDWRNALCSALSRKPNETEANDEDLIGGISPEFYRQVEWLPGCRIENGEVVFDSVFDDADSENGAYVGPVCDNRARNLLLNYFRMSDTIEYINIGIIRNSMAAEPLGDTKRGIVYMVQYREAGTDCDKLRIVRFQKWGVSEHLDEGFDLARSVMQSDEYQDYIMDRRLACRQLGMKLPPHVYTGQIAETYSGFNSRYSGITVWSRYYERAYICGTASDKVPQSKLRNPVWSAKFAALLGEAAAIDMVVGRADEYGRNLFDKIYEIVQTGSDSMPLRIAVTDQRGAFGNYLSPFEDYAAAYARPVNRRLSIVANPKAFASAYVEGFVKSLRRMKEAYLSRRHAFDGLFSLRRVDTGGSGAYRWQCVLKRLENCNIESVENILRESVDLKF